MSRPRHRPSPNGRPAPARATTSAAAAVAPLGEAELDELQALLDTVPAPLEPLDVSMLDGYLCGVLVQPRVVELARWLPHVTDVDGRALPAGFDCARLHLLARRRHAELDAAIGERRWFDPWIFELDDDPDSASLRADDEDTGVVPAEIDAVYPWVAGFATALELFPALMGQDERALIEPLALLYRHLAPDDLEDADELLAEIETLEPPVDLDEAAEDLVRATLLLADVGRPPATPHAAAARRRRPGAPQRR